jgi:hypothetical protein
MWLLMGVGFVAHLKRWSCSGSLVEMWLLISADTVQCMAHLAHISHISLAQMNWLIGGVVVAHWCWFCGSFNEMQWLIGGDSLVHFTLQYFCVSHHLQTRGPSSNLSFLSAFQ